MALSNLDLKYAELVDQLQELNSKWDLFLNGDSTVTIPSGTRTIKSLAGIIADITSGLPTTPTNPANTTLDDNAIPTDNTIWSD